MENFKPGDIVNTSRGQVGEISIIAEEYAIITVETVPLGTVEIPSLLSTLKRYVPVDSVSNQELPY